MIIAPDHIPFFPTDHDYHHLAIGYQHGSCAHQTAWQLGIKPIIKWVSLSHHNQVLFLQIDPKSFCPSQFGLYQKHQTPMPSGLVKLRPSFITLRFSWTLCFLWWKHCLLTNQVVKTKEKRTLFFNMIWKGK